jgi:hypothetical protein
MNTQEIRKEFYPRHSRARIIERLGSEAKVHHNEFSYVIIQRIFSNQTFEPMKNKIKRESVKQRI